MSQGVKYFFLWNSALLGKIALHAQALAALVPNLVPWHKPIIFC